MLASNGIAISIDGKRARRCNVFVERHPIRPTSTRCPTAWQPIQGRGPTQRRGKSVQTTGTTSVRHGVMSRSHYDNAMVGSFFATLECKLLDRGRSIPKPKRAWRSSNSSTAFAIPAGAIIAWPSVAHYVRARVCSQRSRARVHTSMPSCSRLPRSGLKTSPTCWPSLTAARHDGLARCWPGRKNPRGRTKRSAQRGGQNAVKPDQIPRSLLYTKSGEPRQLPQFDIE